ncbi:MAG TPA: thioredoxin domain-containing protein [Fodinibius sp.]|nr:thioredoxin domain-containing protein [Fodinibius sp.]
MLLRTKTFIVGLAAAFVFVGCQNSDTEAQSSQSEQTDKLVITEYSDYQCPACAYFHPFVEKIKKTMGDKVTFNLRYFPLQSHRYSALAARAAQAAKNQGKFIEMHNLLFEQQQQWVSSSNPATAIVNFARRLDLDLNQFTEELNAAETQEIVMEQRQEGIDKGVNSTPTFFIEGEKLDPLPKTYEEFKKAIEKHLNEKG